MPRFGLGRSRGLAGLIESDSDDLHFDQGSTIMTSDSEGENVARPVKRSSKTQVAPPKSKRQKMSPPQPPPPKERRGALKDKTAGRHRRHEASDTEDAREFDERADTVDETLLSMDELDASMISIQRPVKVSTTKAKVAEKQVKPSKTKRVKAEPIVEETPRPIKRESKFRKEEKPVQKKRRREEETEDEAANEIPETQVAVEAEEQLEQSIEEEVIEEFEAEPTPKPVVVRRPSVVRKQKSPVHQTSIQLRHTRGGSFSDTERIDPAGRRRIGDLQAKLDKLELKYHKLREVGVDEAHANYEKLRKQSEKSSKASKEIIANLKAEVAAKDAKVKEFRNLQKTLDEKDAEIARQKEKAAMANDALSTAQSENKGLMTKLNAMKNAAANIESVNAAKIPGSAQKPGAVRIMGSAETVQAAQVAQLKIALYSDLTGLIVRGVKREEEEDVFDCIQTGKNGSKSPTIGPTTSKTNIHQHSTSSSQFQTRRMLATTRLNAIIFRC